MVWVYWKPNGWWRSLREVRVVTFIPRVKGTQNPIHKDPKKTTAKSKREGKAEIRWLNNSKSSEDSWPGCTPGPEKESETENSHKEMVQEDEEPSQPCQQIPTIWPWVEEWPAFNSSSAIKTRSRWKAPALNSPCSLGERVRQQRTNRHILTVTV